MSIFVVLTSPALHSKSSRTPSFLLQVLPLGLETSPVVYAQSPKPVHQAKPAPTPNKDTKASPSKTHKTKVPPSKTHKTKAPPSKKQPKAAASMKEATPTRSHPTAARERHIPVGTSGTSTSKPASQPSATTPAKTGRIRTPVPPPATPGVQTVLRMQKYQKPRFKGLTKRLLSRKTFFWSQMLGVLFALGVVVLLIYLILRWAAQRAGLHTSGGGALLKVQDRLGLEAKKSLWVVEVAGQYLLLATHEQGVTLIERIDAEAIQKFMDQPDRAPSGFWERLKQGTGIRSEAKSQDSPEKPNSSKDSVPTDFEVISDGQTSSPTHK